MHIRSLVLASLATIAFVGQSFAIDLGRCRDLDPIDGGVTVIPGETVTRFTAASGQPASTPLSGFGPGGRGFEKCELAPVGSGKWINGKPGFAGTTLCLAGADTLALPGSAGGQPFKVKLADTEVENPDIPVHQDGVVDVKDSVKAYAEAVKDAIQNGDPIPKPGPQYEVVDWNPPTEGSSCS